MTRQKTFSLTWALAVAVYLGLAASMFAGQTASAPASNQAQSVPTNPKGCLAVHSIGTHAIRNIALFGVAGAFVSKEQYKVLDVSGYPAKVGQKYHGNDLQMIQSSGTKVVLLPKHYTQDELRQACQ